MIGAIEFLRARLDEDEASAPDPRSLRLVNWRRKQLERHRPGKDWSWRQFGCRHTMGHDGEHEHLCGTCRVCWPCPELAEMLLVEAAHPDYREDWMP